MTDKPCFGKFKLPDCLVKSCRHSCINEFNKGKLIQFKITGGNAVEKEVVHKVVKSVGYTEYDEETLLELLRIVSLYPIEQRKSNKGIKWLYKGKILARITKARKGAVVLEARKGFGNGMWMFESGKKVIRIKNIKKESAELKKALKKATFLLE